MKKDTFIMVKVTKPFKSLVENEVKKIIAGGKKTDVSKFVREAVLEKMANGSE